MKHDYPLLGGIASLIRWAEELISLVAGPLLTVGLGISLTDLLTGGRLLSGLPILLFVWAVAQAIGIEAQLMASWDRCRQAIRERRWLAVTGLVLLGCALGYIGFLSAEAFNMQQSFELTEVEALARLGIDPVSWALQRAGLAVFLVALSGFTRFHPAPATLEDERSELHRELELTPLRQRLAEMKTVGAVAVARSVANAAVGKQSKTKKPTPPTSPTGGGSPSQKPATDGGTATPDGVRLLTPMNGEPARRVARGRMTLRDKIWRALDSDSTLTKSALARRFRCSESVASKYKGEWAAQTRDIAQ